MNHAELTRVTWQLLAVLAGEVLFVSALLWLFLKYDFSAIWRRTICRAALICALLIVGLEFSGAGRSAAVWIASALRHENQPVITTSEKAATGEESTPQSMRAASIPDSEPGRGSAERSGTFVSAQAGIEAPTGVLPARAVHAQASQPATSSTPKVALALLSVWFCGAAVLVLRAAAGRWALTRWRRRCCRLIQDGEIIEAVARWSAVLGIRRPIRVIESGELQSPIAFGIVWPTIGLPLHFQEQFNAARGQAMLGHELAHLAGRDPQWCLMAELAAALLWWHPAIWWMRHQLQLSAELAADDSSLLIADGPRVLSECLVELGAKLLQRPAPGQLSAGGFKSSLGCRVERLLQIEGRAFAAVDKRKAALTTIFGPVAMAAMVVICSAWMAPGEINKGKIMKSSKKKSLALLALTALFAGTDHPLALAQTQAPPGASAAPVPYGRGGGAAAQPSAGLPFGNGPAQNRGSGFTGGVGVAADPFAPGVGNGMLPRAGWRGDSERGAQLDAKLRGIMLDEVAFDGLPLAEVLRFVSDESRKHDPEKKGINFLIKPNVGWAQPQPPAIDPTTGLPLSAPAPEPIDVGGTSIKFNLPLRHISMKDLLDAVVKVADKPIEYTLEDYGVVFSIRPEGFGLPATGPMMAQAQPMQNHFAVQTFRVNTNTFAAGMEHVFGIKLNDGASAGGKDGLRSRQVQAAMKDLLLQLGINLEGGKTVFYNEITGVLMVRATIEDLEVVRAAIETLGEPEKDQASGVGFAPGGAGEQGQPNARLSEPERQFRARYGLPGAGR